MPRPQQLPPPRTDQASILLRQTLAGLQGEHVSVGDIVLGLRRRSFGGILLLLTILGLLPVVSFFAGLMMLIPGIQMAAGYHAPGLPRLLAEQRVGSAQVRALGERVLPWIERAERYIRPRWLFLTWRPVAMATGLVIVCLALALLVPVPLINVPPALALLCLSLGILERDGLMVAGGLILAAGALLFAAVTAMVAIEAASLVLRAHGG